MSKSSTAQAAEDLGDDEQLAPTAVTVIHSERGAYSERAVEPEGRTDDELRAEARERDILRGSFSIQDNDASWEKYKSELAAKKAEHKRLAIGVDAAEKLYAEALAKKEATTAAHEDAGKAVENARQEAAQAEGECAVGGEAAWSAYKKALDRVQMHEHLSKLAERAMTTAHAEHDAAWAVAERERAAANMKTWSLQFDEAVRLGSAGMDQVLTALSVASGLMQHDAMEFHVRRWARGVQDQMRRSHPEHQMSPGIVSDMSLLRSVLGDLA